MKLIIGCDHGGFDLKQALMPCLKELGYEFEDVGCYTTDSVDYPDIAIAIAKRIASGEFERGIVICGTGIGVSIAANKVKGIRCSLCGDILSAKLTREHNNANLLALGGRIIGVETAKAIAQTWLTTEFAGGRHERRVNKITQYETEEETNG